MQDLHLSHPVKLEEVREVRAMTFEAEKKDCGHRSHREQDVTDQHRQS